MLQRIRYAMNYGTFDKPLKGTVEIDETYIGGVHKGLERISLVTKWQLSALLKRKRIRTGLERL